MVPIGIKTLPFAIIKRYNRNIYAPFPVYMNRRSSCENSFSTGTGDH
jgi:hypothetical protein